MQRLTRAQSRLMNGQNYPIADKQALGAQAPSRHDTSISKIPRLKKRQREIPVNLADLDGAPELKRAKKDVSSKAPQFKPVVASEQEQCTLADRLNMKTVMENHDIESLRGFLRSAQSNPGRRVFLLHEAVRHAWLHGIDTLAEFGALKESLKMDLILTQKGLPTLL